MNPFDYVKSINESKVNLMIDTENDELAEKAYVPFLTNKSFSYHLDTILYANEINQFAHMDNKFQYEYYLNGIPKKKRYSQWAKKSSNEDLDIVAEYYGCNYIRAAEILTIINKKQFSLIKNKLQKGGTNE